MGANHPRFESRSITAKIALFALLAGIAPAHAAAAAGAGNDCQGPSDDCAAIGRWNFSVALGAGVRTNPLVNGENIPLAVIPHVSYYGKRVFLDDLDLGVTLAETNTNTLNLIASPSYDRVYFYRTDLQNLFVTGFPDGTFAPVRADTPGAVKVPPRSRRITYLAGPEWTFKFLGVSGQFDFLHEVTGQNHGDEIRAALGIPLIESRGSLMANLGITWKSAAIVNYYYGAPGIYQPGSALEPFFKLGYTLPLSGKWRFNAFAEIERLGNSIVRSPIVAEHDVATVFVGAIYSL
jgi:MipA family protein